jgi:hypothetical protein
MPWSAGLFTRTDGTRTGTTVWQQAKAALVGILASSHDAHDQDLATGINACLLKDGSNSLTGNLNAASNKITSLATGTVGTDAVNLSQITGVFQPLASNLTEISSLTNNVSKTAIIFCKDNGGVALVSGVLGDIQVPFNCTINSVTVLADTSGSMVLDIWKDTYANFPPTVADTITASAKPTISSATKYYDATLTGWTKTISAGDIIRFKLDSISTITRIMISIGVTRT